MSGSLGDMGNLLKQAQVMQRELDKVREDLRTRVVQGSSGGGAVQVEVTGDRKLQSIKIAPEVIQSGDVSVVEDLVLSALRDGLGKAEKLSEESMGRVTGGMNLPGLF